MPPEYTSFPLRKDFYLADDAARSPGGGVRHMEQTHTPRGGDTQPMRRSPGA
jgi:NADH:ubiquinone oxidoreductase subunit C